MMAPRLSLLSRKINLLRDLEKIKVKKEQQAGKGSFYCIDPGSSYYHIHVLTSRVEDSVDPDQLASQKKYINLSVWSDDLRREDGSTISVGDRVDSDGYFATVKYIGLVPPTKGIWIGVEWDDERRGKHDGSHEGHRYFTTRWEDANQLHPKSGSFLRPKKTNLGVPLMAAVEDRYGRVEDENAGVITDDLYVVGGKNKQTVVEMVGARKVNDLQSKLDELKDVVLRGMLIYGTDMSHDLSMLVPSIRDLDISQSLVPNWQTVADITKQLKNLKSLNVSDNRLQFPDTPTDLCKCFMHIKVLYLNRMEYTWEQILLTASMFSSLEKLHLCFNNIKSITNLQGQLEKLKLINFESNKLDSWSEVLKLGNLPQLETVILSDNNLSSISFDETAPTETTTFFSNLRSLTLNHNSISEWSSINELNKLKLLEELRMLANPLVKSTNPETFRQILIAKLKHLNVCNRTEVTSEERKGAEIDYLKRFGPSWVKCGGSQDPSKSNPTTDFIKTHPRFEHLVSVWGAPEDSEMQKQSTSLKSSLICVKITCPSLPDKPMMEKKLPGTMTIQKLKALIHRLYKIDEEVSLSYISQQMEGQEIELDNDQRVLSYYSIDPGDVIQVKI